MGYGEGSMEGGVPQRHEEVADKPDMGRQTAAMSDNIGLSPSERDGMARRRVP